MSNHSKKTNTGKSNSPYGPSFYTWAERCRNTPYHGRSKAIERLFLGLNEQSPVLPAKR